MLVYYKNSKWHICAEKVRYIQCEEEVEQYIGSEGHDWWLDFEERWDHTTVLEFIPVVPTEEQMARIAEVNGFRIPDGYGELVGRYVEEGVFPAGYTHPLGLLQLKKEQALQDAYLLELDFRQAMAELGV